MTVACARCGAEVPAANRQLHELRCRGRQTEGPATCRQAAPAAISEAPPAATLDTSYSMTPGERTSVRPSTTAPHRRRSGGAAAASPPQSAAPPALPTSADRQHCSPTPTTAESWSCAACTFTNSGRSACAMCGAAAPAAVDGVRAADPTQRGVRLVDDSLAAGDVMMMDSDRPQQQMPPPAVGLFGNVLSGAAMGGMFSHAAGGSGLRGALAGGALGAMMGALEQQAPEQQQQRRRQQLQQQQMFTQAMEIDDIDEDYHSGGSGGGAAAVGADTTDGDEALARRLQQHEYATAGAASASAGRPRVTRRVVIDTGGGGDGSGQRRIVINTGGGSGGQQRQHELLSLFQQLQGIGGGGIGGPVPLAELLARGGLRGGPSGGEIPGYDDLLRMFGDGRAPRARAEQADIDSCPTHEFQEEEEEEEEEEGKRGDEHGQKQTSCSVCLEDFSAGERVRTLPCGHRFHADCIDRWLRECSRECPLCKREV